MSEYTHGGWMPPQEPSASWRCDDPALGPGQQRQPAQRTDRPALVAVQEPVEERRNGPAQVPSGGRRRGPRPVRSSSMLDRDRPDRPVGADDGQGDHRLAGPAAEVVDVEGNPRRQEHELGRAGPGGSSHGHSPNRASQIRVKTRVAPMPPAPRMYSAARPCAASSGRRRPAGGRRRPRRWSRARAGRRRSWPRSRRRAGWTGSSGPSPPSPSSVRMPRNWRSSRSSASMVTLVSSSPFHQPSRAAAGQCVGGAIEARGADDAVPAAGRRLGVSPSTAKRRSRSSVALGHEAGDGRQLGRGRRRRGRTGRARPAPRRGARRRCAWPPRRAPRLLDQTGGPATSSRRAARREQRGELGAGRRRAASAPPPAGTSCAGRGRCRPACRCWPGSPQMPSTSSTAWKAMPRCAPKRRGRPTVASAAPASTAPMAAAHGQQGPGLARLHGAGTPPTLTDARGLERHVVGLAGDHLLGGASARAPGRGTRSGVGSSSRTWTGQGGQGVADDDGRPVAEGGPHRRPVPALAVVVDDVVVDQREVVDQLDRHCAGDARPPRAPPAAAAETSTSAARTRLPPPARWWRTGSAELGAEPVDRRARAPGRPARRPAAGTQERPVVPASRRRAHCDAVTRPPPRAGGRAVADR